MKRKGALKKPKKRTVIILVIALVIVAASAGVWNIFPCQIDRADCLW